MTILLVSRILSSASQGTEKIHSKLVKYSAGLYVKPLCTVYHSSFTSSHSSIIKEYYYFNVAAHFIFAAVACQL